MVIPIFRETILSSSPFLKKKKDLKIIFDLNDFNCPFSKLVPLSGPFEKKDDRQCAFHGGTASRAALVMTRIE